MAEWFYTNNTYEKGNVTVTVKAKDKPEAIKKGKQAIEKKGLTPSYHWYCSLKRV